MQHAVTGPVPGPRWDRRHRRGGCRGVPGLLLSSLFASIIPLPSRSPLHCVLIFLCQITSEHPQTHRGRSSASSDVYTRQRNTTAADASIQNPLEQDAIDTMNYDDLVSKHIINVNKNPRSTVSTREKVN